MDLVTIYTEDEEKNTQCKKVAFDKAKKGTGTLFPCGRGLMIEWDEETSSLILTNDLNGQEKSLPLLGVMIVKEGKSFPPVSVSHDDFSYLTAGSEDEQEGKRLKGNFAQLRMGFVFDYNDEQMIESFDVDPETEEKEEEKEIKTRKRDLVEHITKQNARYRGQRESHKINTTDQESRYDIQALSIELDRLKRMQSLINRQWASWEEKTKTIALYEDISEDKREAAFSDSERDVQKKINMVNYKKEWGSLEKMQSLYELKKKVSDMKGRILNV